MDKVLIKDFSLLHTIECGQFFIYEFKENGFYEIINYSNKFFVKQDENYLYFENISEKDLKKFLGLDIDLNILYDEDLDEYVKLALEKYWGMRIVQSELWQTIISFVCSSASNISKIKMNLRLIIENFSLDGTFPKFGELNDLEKLKFCKTGYRAKYIYEINKMFLEDPTLYERILNSDYKTSKELLMSMPGVGSKVADCICLFSLRHLEAFPVDTWIKQIIERLYLDKKTSLKEIEKYIEKKFNSKYKGIIQQYLFHYVRNNPEILK